MSAKFLFPLFFVCFFINAFSQNTPCSRQELILSLTDNTKFKEANSLLENKNYEDAFKLIKDLREDSKFNSNFELNNYVLFLEADFHRKTNSFRKSISTYKTLLNRNLDNPDLIFFSNLSIGDIYVFGIEDYNLGIQFYKKAEQLLVEKSCIDKQTLIYNALGNSNLLNENYSDAEIYYNKCLNIYEKNNEINRLSRTYNNLGNLYFEQYQDTKAKTYFLKALNTFKKKDSTNINLRQQFNYNLFAVNEALGNYKEAIGYLEKSNTLRDSIWNRDKVWEIAEYDKKFAIAEKQKEVTVLEAEGKAKDAQRNAFLISAAVLLMLLGVSIYYYLQKVKTNKIISSQNKTLDNLNATKDKLFSIVSHDLRSSVNALKTSNKTLISNLETKNIDKLEGLLTSNSNIVNGAYNLLDNLLNWAMLQTKQTYFLIEPHKLHHIVEQVAYNYEALFTEKNIAFKNEVSKKAKVLIDKESFRIILRNLIDNAIKFTQQNGEISIFTEDANYYHKLIVQDNGLGMSADKKAELLSDSQLLSKKENEDVIGTGLGMQLCKSLIKKNNGKLDIDTQFGVGTKIIVSLQKANTNG